ncbi:hypothetical protein SynPROS91_02396 [Synechococcus sp. PROS-9-1]|nr:hypothetical protein SynPROS91_02396 [Synechococcus sp. PROS-9-1]
MGPDLFFNLQMGQGLCCVDDPDEKWHFDRDCFLRSKNFGLYLFAVTAVTTELITELSFLSSQ